MDTIQVIKSTHLKDKPKTASDLGFGKLVTDHMFMMTYDGEWKNPRIKPYENFSLSPLCATLHYAQSIFEGMKAYRTPTGDINLFRPRLNFERLNVSCERLAIPKIDVDFALHALKELIKVDQDWVPSFEGTSLYIRPYIFATEDFLGVRPSTSYIFAIVLSPSGSYYSEGLQPVNILIEDSYVRAVRGGTGFVKFAGNYASSLKAQEHAVEKGYAQVLWLDGVHKRYIEEVGAMNVFFVTKDGIITPDLSSGSILPGITRRSAIELFKEMGENIKEEKIDVEDLLALAKKGDLLEVFGTGTAAVVSPVGRLGYKGEVYDINAGKIGSVTQKLYDTLEDIQYGKVADTRGWVEKV